MIIITEIEGRVVKTPLAFPHEDRKEADQAFNRIRDKYGYHESTFGVILYEREATKNNGNDQLTMHELYWFDPAFERGGDNDA